MTTNSANFNRHTTTTISAKGNRRKAHSNCSQTAPELLFKEM